ncbi:type II toxin-antitoxin system HicB family antitoxin [Mesorhizobium sp. ESP-6-2]|nr:MULTISPECIES: type II toxin-antitoxin system HicB family antitoxin [unclassified Mesorhizobium]MBZ9808344.1 type II toxin-antitoxin system HicB family antitoxin [Mesorhizobium sp. ESP-6-2]TPM33516.1 hypothetical protein FJ955_01840 [Mesorhizobium sp. B2-2-2]
MENHLALVEKETNSAFGIRFPDIPGCFSAADAADAADAAEDIVPPRRCSLAIVGAGRVRYRILQPRNDCRPP